MQPYSSSSSFGLNVAPIANNEKKKPSKQASFMKKSKSIVSSSELLANPGKQASTGMTASSSEDKPLLQVMKIQESSLRHDEESKDSSSMTVSSDCQSQDADASTPALGKAAAGQSVSEVFKQRLSDYRKQIAKTMNFAD